MYLTQQVRDGHKDATPVLQKTCSPLRDVRLMSTARWLRVEFKSDGQFAGSGLKAFYSERLGGDELDRNRFPLDGCLSFEFECGNAECLSRSYVCDGFNDCGCEGNCDEDNCEKTQIGQLAASLIGIIIGVGIFTTLFALAYSQENKLRKRAQGLLPLVFGHLEFDAFWGSATMKKWEAHSNSSMEKWSQSLQSTPDTLEVQTTTTVPETPNSQISDAQSPCSPVFRPRVKTGKRKLDDLSDSEETNPSLKSKFNGTSSQEESPWLSKAVGGRLNGFVYDKNRPSDESKRQRDLDYLRSVFPGADREDLIQSLEDARGDRQDAVDIQLDKNERDSITLDLEESQSPIIAQPTKKFRRIISSDSEDASVTPDKQESESACPDSQTLEDRITFLLDVFPNFTKERVLEELKKADWSVEEATIHLSDSMDSEGQNEFFLTGNSRLMYVLVIEVSPTFEDEVEEEENYQVPNPHGGDEKLMMLSFFQEATKEELMSCPGCSKKKAELIMSQRPFETWDELCEKFTNTKGLTFDLIPACKEIMHVREVILRLMERSCLTKELQLKPYQMVGLNWLRILHDQEVNGILADEMGLGKTIQAIAFLAHLLDIGEEGPHLIVVPSSTIDNWVRELKTWCPDLKVLLYYGTQEERVMHRESIYNDDHEYHIVLTTYNMATGNVKDRVLFKKFYFQYAIFDEGHLLKNMSSNRYQHLMKIQADNRLLLTGTPLQNNLLELMSLLCFVMPDMFIGKTEQLKRMFTCYSRGSESAAERSKFEEERIAHAKRIMQPFVLRRLKTEVLKQLPAKLERVESCVMIPDQQDLYDNLVQQFRCRLDDKQTINNNGAGMLMQLRKIANHPLLHRSHYTDAKLQRMAEILAREPSHAERGALPDLIYEDMTVMSDFELYTTCVNYKKCLSDYILDLSYISESAKFRVLDDMLETMKSNGDRVLLFSQFTMMMDIMEVYLKERGYSFCRLDGSTPVQERQKLIDDYNTNKDIFVFMLSTKAGGMGINLTAANVVILHDIDFNPYNDKQAEDRCHRLGQTKEVNVVRLICKGTVEEAMLRCAEEKLKLEQDITKSNTESSGKATADVVKLLKEALQYTS
ncbi:hypothetical protein ScPMuIL_012535 [Solemya velum]